MGRRHDAHDLDFERETVGSEGESHIEGTPIRLLRAGHTRPGLPRRVGPEVIEDHRVNRGVRGAGVDQGRSRRRWWDGLARGLEKGLFGYAQADPHGDDRPVEADGILNPRHQTMIHIIGRGFSSRWICLTKKRTLAKPSKPFRQRLVTGREETEVLLAVDQDMLSLFSPTREDERGSTWILVRARTSPVRLAKASRGRIPYDRGTVAAVRDGLDDRRA